MNILTKTNHVLLIEQYKKIYLRFREGGIPLQVEISEEDKEKICSGAMSCDEMLQIYKSTPAYHIENLREKLIEDYLSSFDKYSDEKIMAYLKNLKRYDDIFDEFYYYVSSENFKENGVTVEGYQAKRLLNEYSLSPLRAYNMLIYLREEPEEALKKLKEKSPNRDISFQQEIQNLESNPEPAPVASNEQLNEQLLEIQQKLVELHEIFNDKIFEDEHKNALFDNMHRELTKYQSGAIEKILEVFALDIIQLIDTTKGHIKVYEEKEFSEENYSRLLRVLKGVAEDLQDVLYRESIESFTVAGDEVDVKKQKIIQTIATEDPEKNNHVAFRVAEGYEKNGKVIRPERIKIFKYQPKK